MNASKKLLAAITFAVFVATLFSCQKEEEVPAENNNTSEFHTGVDQWRIEGDAQGGEIFEPTFSPIEGLDNSGYVYATDDVAGGVWYFIAPSKFRGNKSTFFDGKLTFWLIQKSAFSNQFFDEDVVIDGGNNEKLVYYHSIYPASVWTYYQIELNSNGNWFDENGLIASDTKIKRVLGSITKISIRGEFETGSDTGGLDSFSFLAK